MKTMFALCLDLMRFDRPIGWWLLLLPCWWGLAFAGAADLWLYPLFLVGAVVMRGAGCVINDMWDVDLDKKVERTACRPLAAGKLSMRQAALFLVFLLTLGLGVLMALPMTARLVAVASLPLVVLYPLMKRVTWWPQLFLGLAFNWGVFVGWFSVSGEWKPFLLVLYLSGIFWTLAYDTIYAHMDKRDDVHAGIKSSALRLGGYARRGVFLFMALALILFCLAGWLVGAGWAFYPLWAVAALYALHVLSQWQDQDSADCLVRFKQNRNIGLLLFVASCAI